MKCWFVSVGNKDHGLYSHVPGLTMRPVAWQGWLATAVYFAVLGGIVFYHLPRLRESALVLGSLLVSMIVWHLLVLRLASCRFGKVE